MRKSLGLRTRVILFFVLAALPSMAVTGFTVNTLDRFIQDEVEKQQRDLERLILSSLTSEKERIQRELKKLCKDDRIIQMVAQSDDVNALVDFEDVAPQISSKVELSALAFIARSGPARGTILSSSHMPQAVGDSPPFELFIESVESSTAGIASDYIASNPPKLTPFLLSTAFVTDPSRSRSILLYGGTRLDGSFLERIAQITSSQLSLHLPDGATYKFGATHGDANSGSIYIVPISGYADRHAGGQSRIHASLPISQLEKFQQELLFIGIFANLFILLAGILGGFWLSRPITRPIVALSSAAKRVGDGDYTIRVAKERNDEVGQLVEVFNDMVGEIVTTQAELAQAERMAACRDAAKQVAHEIKNPLTPMRMSMETLRKAHQIQHASFDEILQESTQAVLEEVQALSRIVSAFSEFAKLPTPIIKLEEPVMLLANVKRLYGALPENIKIIFEEQNALELNLPSVLVDKDQFSRVFVNLVKNAVEAIGQNEGCIYLEASIDTEQPVKGVRFVIRDNGPGIPNDTLDKVLTPYFTTKSKGTGLGLAIVNRIVDEHGGFMAINSQVDDGTAISIWLPAEDA
ncbi:MAG: ATP-binding protein [Myxococcota bacterium]|nr:ATP-binding protein [Myxococcota bacterium]